MRRVQLRGGARWPHARRTRVGGVRGHVWAPQTKVRRPDRLARYVARRSRAPYLRRWALIIALALYADQRADEGRRAWARPGSRACAGPSRGRPEPGRRERRPPRRARRRPGTSTASPRSRPAELRSMSRPVSSPATRCRRPNQSLARAPAARSGSPRADPRGARAGGARTSLRSPPDRAGPSEAARRTPPRAAPSVREAPHESDAVLRDRKSLVGPGRRQRGPGLQMQLVGGPDEARAERARNRSCHPWIDCTSARASSAVTAAQRGQALAVAREAHRHDRRAGDRGVQRASSCTDRSRWRHRSSPGRARSARACGCPHGRGAPYGRSSRLTFGAGRGGDGAAPGRSRGRRRRAGRAAAPRCARAPPRRDRSA